MFARTQLFLIVLLLAITNAFGQLDPDFLRYKKMGDDCYSKKDYVCAEKNYGLAIKIKINDPYCKQQIENCKQNRLAEVEAKKQGNKKPVNKRQAITSTPKTDESEWKVETKDGKWGYIDKEGKTVIPFRYELTSSFKEGLAWVMNDKGKYGYIDKNEKVVIPFYYDVAVGFSEGLAWVHKRDKWGLITKNGKIALPFTHEYENVRSFADGLAGVQKNGKWGFIDKTGNVVIPFQFDSVTHFESGYTQVKKDGREFTINKAGVRTKIM